MTQHTPTPWGAGEFPSHIHGPDGIGICKFESKHGFYKNWQDNADFIVTAVNSHDDMKGKLEQAGAVIGSLLRAFSGLTQIPLNNMEYAKLEYYFTSDDPYDPDLNVPELAKVRSQA